MDLESVLPDKFRQQMRSLKAEIDSLETRLQDKALDQADTEDAARAAAEAFKAAFSSMSDEELSTRENLLKIVKDVHLTYKFQRHKTKVFGAVSDITIIVYPPKDNGGKSAARADWSWSPGGELRTGYRPVLTYDQTQRQWMPGLAPWQAALRQAFAVASAASAVGGGGATGKS